jgi:hypothetical protein
MASLANKMAEITNITLVFITWDQVIGYSLIALGDLLTSDLQWENLVTSLIGLHCFIMVRQPNQFRYAIAINLVLIDMIITGYDQLFKGYK